MIAEREVIHRLDLHCLISVSRQIFQISCQCLRITGHIDNPLWPELYYRRKELLITSGSRRIHEYHICFLVLRSHIYHESSRITCIDLGILDAIFFCVDSRIFHRIFVQLYSNDSLCIPGCNQTNCTAEPIQLV